MKKTSFQKFLLTQAVLASTLFVSPITHADPVPVNQAGPINTSAAITKSYEIPVAGNVIGAGTDGVVFDSIPAALTIDANNHLGASAILTTGAVPVSGVQIDAGFPGGMINIKAGSGITNSSTNALSNAIEADATVQITNAGTILNNGAGSAFNILFNTAPNSVLENSGSIISVTGNPIAINSPSTGVFINNAPGGVIQSSTGGKATISYVAGGSGLILNNAGSIVQTNANENTLDLLSPFVNITNQANGVISQTGGGALSSVIAVRGGGAGIIENQKNASIIGTTASTIGINVTTAAFGGSILNAGLIKTNTGAAIFLDQSVTGTILNDTTGSIITATPVDAAIVSNLGTIVTGGIVNKGLISGLGGKAIDLSNNTAATLVQLDGNIFGDVFLAEKDSNNGIGKQSVFVMADGTVSGNVVATTGVVGDFNYLLLNGGQISGNVTLGDNGDTLDLNVIDDLNPTAVLGNIFGGAGNDTVNVKGGSFGSLDGKGGTANELNILATFTADGPIANMNQINVKTQGTIFTLNNNITNMDANLTPGLTIDKGTQVALNGNISGSGDVINNGLLSIIGTPTIDLDTGLKGIVINNGTVDLGSQVLTVISDVNGAFRNQAGGIVKVNVNGISTPNGLLSNGELIVKSTAPAGIQLDAGSFIQPVSSGFIPQGTRFDVMTITAPGTITNPLVSGLIQPSSAVIFFNQELNGTNNILSLVGGRHSFESLSSTQVTKGVAGALDILALGNGPTNAGLLNLLIQLDGLATQAEVEAAMESLIPPFNYGLVAGSHIGMDSAFESVIMRLEDLYARKRGSRVALGEGFTQLAENGVSYGDSAGIGSIWGKVLGANLNQKERGGVAGYKAKGAGLAIGADWDANNCTTFGLAASYTKVDVDDKNASPKDQAIKSWQGTAYGWWEFMDGLYLDAMLGVSSNHYKLNRVINVNQLHTAAQSSFHGTQWGAQADLGWSLANCESYYLAPFARLKYIHLDLNDYSENGAGDLSLDVHNDNVKEFLGGLGFRLGYLYQVGDILYAPEVSVMLGYDFKNDGEQTVAGFFGGGPAFGTDGIKPGRTIFDLGLMLNAHVSSCSILTAKYNLELRSEFVSNAVYLQYNYLWS